MLTERRVGEAGECFLVTVSINFFPFITNLSVPRLNTGGKQPQLLSHSLPVFVLSSAGEDGGSSNHSYLVP